MFDRLKRAIKAIDQYDFETKHADLEEYAHISYQQLIVWFHPPTDIKKECEIALGPRSAMARDWLTGNYCLIIASNLQSVEEKYMTVAHEMYHRVTSRRKGLHCSLWVDEMLAFWASYRILCDNGQSDYANGVYQAYCDEPYIASIQNLKITRAVSRLPWVVKNVYPPGFTAGCIVVGEKLISMVGWDAFWNIVASKTWEEWLANIPLSQQQIVCDILDIP